LNGFAHNVFREGRARNVSGERNAFPTSRLDLVGNLLGGLDIHIAHYNLGSLPGKEQSSSSPDPPARTRNNSYLIFEHLFHGYSPFFAKPKKTFTAENTARHSRNQNPSAPLTFILSPKGEGSLWFSAFSAPLR